MNYKYGAARFYAEKGYPVLPLQTVIDGRCSCGKAKCQSPGKHPRKHHLDLPNGHKNATTGLKQIKKWWKRWPDANIGIRTGQKSFIAIDIDLPEGPDNLAKLEEQFGKLPETVKQVTGGGGYQLFFKPPKIKIKNSAGKIAPKIDVRGAGGLVVVPPSDHLSGQKYKFVNDFVTIDLAEMPEWLVDICTKGKKYCEYVHTQTPIPEGQRNENLTSIGGYLRSRGHEADEIFQILLKINHKRCAPQLEDSEVKKIADSVSRYEPKSTNTDGHKKKNLHKEFVNFLMGKIDTLEDSSGGFYAIVKREHGIEALPTRSEAFKRYCRYLFKNEFDALLNRYDMEKIIKHVESEVEANKNKGEVFVRLAGYKEKIYLDLANDQLEVVEISSDGWKVIQETPVFFHRPPGMQSLPTPVKGGSFKKLIQFLPKGKEYKMLRRLILAWLVGSLNPEGPYVILVLYGTKGASKTTLMDFLKSLIDPSDVTSRSLSRREEDLMIYCKHNWIISFDNVTNINWYMSDALCRVSTNGGLSRRKLYTDDQESVFKANRPIVLNGITNFVRADDLTDRALILYLPPIKGKQRLTEKDLKNRFEKARPEILGALIDAVSTALKNKDLELNEDLPRMADFVKWVFAAEGALPWKEGQFLKDYKTHVKMNLETIYLENMLVFSIRKLLDKNNGSWEGTASKLLKRLQKIVPAEEIDSLPKPNKMYLELTKATNAFNHFGISFSRKRRSDERILCLCKE